MTTDEFYERFADARAAIEEVPPCPVRAALAAILFAAASVSGEQLVQKILVDSFSSIGDK